ncbi:DNA alkylation repair protein [Flavisolibacter tropicus]|uniref:DNA alkylation repair protein n=1 Tax=Flavisolibacter tropicus TaxID=1492898 RepID=A0A172TSV0_9BACT|nr:DNA alkylation repair protein [Flavisolibacter tropicus]ANE49857.1 DNA alkylation repair protein [Flavisolibacter tropicus]
MTCEEIMQQLEAMGTESCKKIFLNHGAKEPLFGVKVGDLKTIQKKIKKNHALSLELYRTGNSDAQYLAGLIADEKKISKEELQEWANNASSNIQSEYTVAWIAAESAFGNALSLEWIDAKEPQVQVSGWSTLSNLVGIKKDEELDLAHLQQLLQRVTSTIHTAPNRVRYAMNNYVLAIGCHVKSLTAQAIEAGKVIGQVMVDMGGTACKVPYAPEYIERAAAKGKIGNKKKMARC